LLVVVLQITQASGMFTWFTYMRLAALMCILSIVDASWMYYTFNYTYEKGPSVLLLFLLEVELHCCSSCCCCFAIPNVLWSL
jgi:hypothetical protein